MLDMANNCDPQTGICTPSTTEELIAIGQNTRTDRQEIIYVGDPMCSWCWGISPALIQLRDHFVQEKIAFKVLVGGLRPGGGDPWDADMKEFLRHHWEQVYERSGQPFGYKLMELDDFNYDTEPSCRAVVAVRPLIKEKEMEFFEAIQRKFYVESQDPNKSSFYASICDQFEVNYGEFLARFESESVKHETTEEFNLNRRWGVRGYPSVLLLHNDQLYQIANGYATFEQMKMQIEELLLMES
jgi:putative protein-disulfide isomerase